MQDNRNNSDKYSGDTGAAELLAKLKKNIAETGGQPAKSGSAAAVSNNEKSPAPENERLPEQSAQTDGERPDGITRGELKSDVSDAEDIKAKLARQLKRDLDENAELIAQLKSEQKSGADSVVLTENNAPANDNAEGVKISAAPAKPAKTDAPQDDKLPSASKGEPLTEEAAAPAEKSSAEVKTAGAAIGGAHESAIDPRSAVYHFKTMSKAEYKAERAASPKLRQLPLDRYKGMDGADNANASGGAQTSDKTQVIDKIRPAAKAAAPAADIGAAPAATVSALEEKLNRKKRDDITTRIKDAEEYAKKLDAGKKNEKSGANGKSDDELDDTDVNLMIAFGMDKELKERIGEDKASEIEADIDKKTDSIEDKVLEGGVAREEKKRFEFTSNAQAKKIFTGYKRVYHGLLWRIAACVALIILTFFYENISVFGGHLPTPIDAQIYPVVHVLIGLQMLVLSGALIYKPLYNGMLSLFRLKPAPESITFVLMLFTFLYHIALCFMHISGGPVLYNFPISVAVLMTLICEFMNLRREIYSFNI
ncbi:MAG: hypothetical protein WCQ72_01840, partial [Eubacteriales bacterium]